MKAEGKEKHKERRIAVINVILAVCIISFFVGVVSIYYFQLYHVTRQNIVDQGRINAANSAAQLNMYLRTSMDVLLLTSYSVDAMLQDGASHEEISEYLESQTVTVEQTLIDRTTGVFGYIDGEYMDGSGWQPEPGYQPKDRPWYISGIEGKGEVVIVDPYLDLDTGTMILSIVKMLDDGESVIGIDFYMDDLQTTVEEYAEDGDLELILSNDGQIVAHSDPSRVGKNYLQESHALDTIVIGKARFSEENNFYLQYNGRDYLVYLMPLENGWVCIDIIDSTDEYRNMRIPLVITVILSVLLVFFLLFFMVMSGRKSREARLMALKSSRATASNAAKSSFLSNMSHEIRTPINAILGMNEMIQRECEDEEILTYSDNISTAGSTLLSLINDILDFSKIEAGKMEIVPVNYSVVSVVTDLVHMIQPRADKKKLKLIPEIDPEIPKELYGDEIRIKQIISNLLTNAVKYTQEGSVRFCVGFERLGSDPDAILLKVTVRDTGIGIKPEDMEKLFAKFERIDLEHNRTIEGTGLGLNIARMLLDMMGSELKAESTYGEGSTFSFAVRQEVVSHDAVGLIDLYHKSEVDRNKKRYERFTAKEARVLAVDDTPLNLSVFRSLLKRTEIAIDTVESGDEAIEIARKMRYDVIFLDHMMPGKDGIETLKLIREDEEGLNHDTPTVCLTANAISGAKERYLKEGFDDYLSKPIDSKKLELTLMDLLPKHKVQISENTQEETEEETGEENLLPAELKEIEILDMEQGLRNCGSAEMYLDTLKLYVNAIPESATISREFLAKKEYEQATIRIHSMKSSSKIIGAAEIGKLGQRMEDAARDGDTATLANVEAFFGQCEALAKRLEDICKTEEPEKKDLPPITKEALYGLYGEIKKSLAAWSVDEALEKIEEIRNYAVPEEEQDRVNAIVREADNFEYEKITEILQEIEG